MLDALRTLKPWQIAVLVVVTLGIGGGVYGIYNWASGPNTPTLPENTQLVQVQYGDLVNSVSASGSVVFPITEQLTFGSAGTVGEVSIQEGDTVQAGQLLAALDSAAMISLQKAVTQAKLTLQNAEDSLADALDPSAALTELAIAQAETAVASARVALRTAQENLARALNLYTEADIARAELVAFNARIARDTAQENFDRAKAQYELNPTVPQWVQSYEQRMLQLAIAEFDLAEAEETLARMKAGADPLEVDQKQKQLAVAEANLRKAEDDLAGLGGAVDPLVVEQRELEVAAARDALDRAVRRLEAATMVAPFDGVVASMSVVVGQDVTASQKVITLVDRSVVDVSAILDEIDVSQVTKGQKVSVSLDALPDVALSGEVYSISAAARVQSGVVSYPITIRVTLPSGTRLMEGMSATASIVVQEVNNALLVPNQAIGGTFNDPVVQVMVDGATRERAVSLGISDGLWTAVLEGLQAGELVVVKTTTATSSSQPRMIQSFGGFPGGGIQIRAR